MGRLAALAVGARPPPLAAEDVSSVYAVNGDGTIAGGASGGVPVRWHKVAGVWGIEPLDTREGLVLGSNAAGDLVGFVNVLPCATNNGCSHAAIWYAAAASVTSRHWAGR